MKKLYTALLSALIATSPVFAASYRSIHLNLKDNTIVKVSAKDGMTTTFEEKNIVMKHGSGTEELNVTLPLDDIRSWTYSTEPGDENAWAGIEKPEADNRINLWLGEGMITLRNLPEKSKVSLCDISGHQLKTAVATEECTLEVAPGIYILSVNSLTFKIAVSK